MTYELAPRPGIFAVLDIHEMDVPLIGCKLTGVPDPGQRLGELVLSCCLPGSFFDETLVKNYRPDVQREVLLSIFLTFKPIRRGLLACLPATPLILTGPPFLFW